jgi:hypothetical protein
MNILFLFYLPIFTATFGIFLFFDQKRKKKDISEFSLNKYAIAYWLLLCLLIFELLYWFVIPAYNYAS